MGWRWTHYKQRWQTRMAKLRERSVHWRVPRPFIVWFCLVSGWGMVTAAVAWENPRIWLASGGLLVWVHGVLSLYEMTKKGP